VYGGVDDEVVAASCVTGANRTFDPDPLLVAAGNHRQSDRP
jgi:hypothetical protein